MSDPQRPFPPPGSSLTMHHYGLPLSFVSPPQHHHHQSNSSFMNQPEQSHVQHFNGQNVDTALESNDWSPAQFPSMLSGYSCPQQDLDIHMSSQNSFESGLNYESFQPEVFHYPDPQYLQSNNFYSQTASSTTDASHWGPAEPPTPQLQCSPVGYASRDAGLGSWSSADYSFQSNTDSFLQFYPNSYQENQCFLSPSTPGPSPHYPPSFVTSPSNENNAERAGIFVDPGMFTITSEIKGGQSDVIQEQTKPKKATRARVARPRKSRVKSKEKASPLLPVLVKAVMPLSSRRPSHEEAGPVAQSEEGQLHHSLMRDRDRSYYRPPPILSPSRAGPGLHCSLPNTSGAVSMHAALLGTLTSEITAPCINIGRSFQAKIPPIKPRRHAHSDSHKALLLWKPSKELEQSANQQRVDALLKLAQSSVVPRGGANPEDVLLLLSQNRGDFLLTVEKLLNKSPTKAQNPGRQTHILSDYI